MVTQDYRATGVTRRESYGTIQIRMGTTTMTRTGTVTSPGGRERRLPGDDRVPFSVGGRDRTEPTVSWVVGEGEEECEQEGSAEPP